MKFVAVFLYFTISLISADDSLVKETFQYVQQFIETNQNVPGFTKSIRDFYNRKETFARNADVCAICKLSLNELLKIDDPSNLRKTTTHFLVQLCVDIGEYDGSFCDYYVEERMDTVMYIVENRKNLTGDRICGLYLQSWGCKDANFQPWNVTIPYNQTGGKGDPAPSGAIIKEPHKEEVIVQLSDLHYDPDYQLGSNAKCKQAVCCQSYSGNATNAEYAAGYFGHFEMCDVPLQSIRNLFSHVKQQHAQIDYIFLTGDTMSHWTHAKSDNNVNIDELKLIFDAVKDTFGETPVFPILGNHDANPSDYYAPMEVTDATVNSNWLFDFIAEEWTDKWLPKECAETIREGGFYTVLAKPGLRIIALNNNVCYSSNAWLLYDDEDPYGQLQWLTDQLVKAEINKESVYLLQHVPPSETCIRQWAYEYKRIIERFSHVIIAEFNGHTHFDEINLIYNTTNPKEIIHVAYNGGSFSPFTHLNPNYKVYQIDAITHDVLDVAQWTFNLMEANQRKQIKWFKGYSFKETYHLNGLSYEDLRHFHQKLLDDDFRLLKTYFAHYVRNSTARIEKSNEVNLKTVYCRITATNIDEFEHSCLLAIEDGFAQFVETGEDPGFMEDEITKAITSVYSRQHNICRICNMSVNAIMGHVKLHDNQTSTASLIKTICTWIYKDAEYCSKYVDIRMNQIWYIARNRPALNGEKVCAISLQGQGCQDIDYQPWTIDIPKKKKKKTPSTKQHGPAVASILQITDIHYDPSYEPKASIKCEKIYCCQNTTKRGQNESDEAGHWGSYGVCDAPWRAVEATFKQIQIHNTTDFVYFTGDLRAHWFEGLSKTAHIEVTRQVLRSMREALGNIPVYPILGNHDVFPSDTFAPSEIKKEKVSTQWILDATAEEWTKWLPNSVTETVKRGGFYSVLVREGFRIIGLNSNVCSLSNIWLLYEDRDPYGQLQWLADELLKAEENNEIVHILTHTTNGRMCLAQWSHEYFRIVERFSETIAAQFHGHTHMDDMKLFYTTDSWELMNVGFNGGSVTSYINLNPNYKIYHVDERYNVVDFDQWSFNLVEANKNVNEMPVWHKTYTFSTTFNVSSLEYDMLNALYQRYFDDEEMLKEYRRHQARMSEAYLKKDCDKRCLIKTFCELSAVKHTDSTYCQEYRNKVPLFDTVA